MSGINKDEDKMADSSYQEEIIFFKVNDKDGKEVLFRMTRNTVLRSLMHAYCDLMSVKLESCFMFRGCRLFWHDTPDELKMEVGEYIDVLPQMGGLNLSLLEQERNPPLCVCTYTYKN